MGRSDVCRPDLVVDGGLVPIEEPGLTPKRAGSKGGSPPYEPKPVDKRFSRFLIEMNDKPWTNSFDRLVHAIVIHESHDHAVSTAKISLANRNFRFTDDSMWDGPMKLAVYLGYNTTMLTKQGGTFYLTGPKFIFPGVSEGVPTIQLNAVSEDFQLGRTEKRRVWKNKTDAEIVEEIAGEYGWATDVDPTEPSNEHLAQVNESDWKFLNRLAMFHGYQVYVEDGVLHFHKPRFRDSGIKLMYYQGVRSQLGQFVVQSETLHWGTIVRASQIDPMKKEIFNLMSSDKEDEVTSESVRAFNAPVQRSGDMTAFKNSRPEMFMYEEGHEQTRFSLQEEVDGIAEHTRWLVHGEGELIGLETLKPRDMVDLIGLGRASGKYYITDVIHEVKSGGYRTLFRVARSWLGKSTGSAAGDIDVTPEVSTTAVVG